MSSEHFDRWVESYIEYVTEVLGEYKADEYLSNLRDEDLRTIYNYSHGTTPAEIKSLEGASV